MNLLELMFPKYENYAGIIVKNKLKRLVCRKIENKYLFVLSPPFCGSTILNEFISTSPLVSVNNSFYTREGQTLPTVRGTMSDHERRWDETLDFDWNYIKQEWRKYWDISKPVLLEKSPPNIIRVASINKSFPNSYYLIFHRNPYAHCESLIRRVGNTSKEAAEFAIDCLRYQKQNILLSLNSITISYEEFTANPEKTKHNLIDFIPELKDIKSGVLLSARNFKNEKVEIEDLNRGKIDKLSKEQLDDINEVFLENMDLLDFFDYKLENSKPYAQHSENSI